MKNQECVECLRAAQGKADRRLVTWSSLSADFSVVPEGDKNGREQPARIDCRLRGTGANVSPVAMANGVSCVAIGIQGGGILREMCGRLALEVGVQPIIIERHQAKPAVSVTVPNGAPGGSDFHIQPAPLPTEADITDSLADVISSAGALMIGPMPLGDGTAGFLARVASLARYAAIRVHPSLLQAPQIVAKIRSHYGYWQMNCGEAHSLDPSTEDVDLLALRVRHLLGDESEFCITNGGNPSWLWAERRWFRVCPIRLEVSPDTGAGDVFCAAYVVARKFYAAGPQAALEYAVRVAAARISGAAVPSYVEYDKPPHFKTLKGPWGRAQRGVERVLSARGS